jgi:hypothetical protein
MYWQFCPGISDLHAIIFLSRFVCPIWAALFRLSFSGCPVPVILSWMSCSKCSVLAVQP